LSYKYSINTAGYTGVVSGQPSGNSYLQVGSFVNGGSGYYEQDFNTPEIQLSSVQLASGNTFTGTVSVPFTVYSPADTAVETFLRLGLIENADQSNGTYVVDFTDITIAPVPEPASLCGLGAVGSLLLLRRRVAA
jgi:hypothetical protein